MCQASCYKDWSGWFRSLCSKAAAVRKHHQQFNFTCELWCLSYNLNSLNFLHACTIFDCWKHLLLSLSGHNIRQCRQSVASQQRHNVEVNYERISTLKGGLEGIKQSLHTSKSLIHFSFNLWISPNALAMLGVVATTWVTWERTVLFYLIYTGYAVYTTLHHGLGPGWVSTTLTQPSLGWFISGLGCHWVGFWVGLPTGLTHCEERVLP